MAVPNTFATATSAIPLANLDANFAYYDGAFSISGAATTFSGAVTLTSNLTFTGTGNRITGDFSNATYASRVLFQTNTTNGASSIGVIPNGTAVNASLFLDSDSAATNSSRFAIQALGGSEARISSTILGTGTYLPMTFYTGGSERMRLDTSGNLGIGTSSPAAKFDTTGTGTTEMRVRSQTSGDARVGFWAEGAAYNYIQTVRSSGALSYFADLQTFNNGSGTERVRIDSSGNVAIGTTSTGGFRVAVVGSVASSVPLYLHSDASATYVYSPSSVSYFGTTAAYAINFVTNNTIRATIDSSGNVGIGTSSPITTSARLSVKAVGDYDAGLAIGSNASAANWARLDFKNTNVAYTGIIYQDQGGLFNMRNDGAQGIAFSTNGGNERVRIDASGNLGIGTNAPGYKLEVNGAIYQNGGYAQLGNYNAGGANSPVAGGISFSTNVTNGQAESNIWNGNDPAIYANTGILFTQRLTSTTRRDLMFLHNNGSVGFGTNSPAATAILDIQSTTKGVRFPNMTTTQKNAITPGAGTVVFDTTLAKLCVYSGSAWQTITSV